MAKIIAYAKLPLRMDAVKVQKEVHAIIDNEKLHFNTAHYTGEWTVISLRSPGGKSGNILPDVLQGEGFADTELLRFCSRIKELVSTLKCEVMSVRLLNLKKGAVIKEHRDADLCFEKGEVRLHFPVITNDRVAFYVEKKQVVMNEGECWYINANLPHRVANFGETDRIHLVIDCKVNGWLKNVFQTGEITFGNNTDKTTEVEMVIKELRYQNTETSLVLANQLERELHLSHGK